MKSLSLLIVLAMTAASVLAQHTPDQIKSEYRTVSAELQKHVPTYVGTGSPPVDCAPETPGLVARQQLLAAEWLSAWLNQHPLSTCDQIEVALAGLSGDQEVLSPEVVDRSCLPLGEDAYATVAPSVSSTVFTSSNVFIVARKGAKYRMAWSTAQVQQATGEQAEIVAALQPDSSRAERWNPDKWWKSGPLWGASLAKLPDDAEGNARFFVTAAYPPGDGNDGEQISLWSWDGKTARLLAAHAYIQWIDVQDDPGIRLEGDLLKVREKADYRTLSSCTPCDGRQADWTVRITSDGVEELGEISLEPELDAVDELFFRLVHGRDTAEIASPAAIQTAQAVLQDAHDTAMSIPGMYSKENPEADWKKNPYLGEIDDSKMETEANGDITLCLTLDLEGPVLVLLRPRGDRLFIADMQPFSGDCTPHPAPQ